MASLDADSIDWENRRSSLDSGLKALLVNCDRDKLLRQLAASHSTATVRHKESTASLKQARFKDEDYVKQLDACNMLWYLGGLVKELEPQIAAIDEDWKSVDLQTCVDNFVKLNAKRDETTDSLNLRGQYVRILEEVGNKASVYEKQIEQLIGLHLRAHLRFRADLSLTYCDEVLGLSFQQFLECCQQFSVCRDTDLSRLFNFTQLFTDWTNDVFSEVDDGYGIVVDEQEVSLRFKEGKPGFHNSTQSVQQLIRFYNIFLDHNSAKTPHNALHNLKPTIAKSILKYMKARIFAEDNIYPLVVAKLSGAESPLIAELRTISTLLSAWSKDGLCEMEFWMDDLASTWVNDLVSKTMDKVKEEVLDVKGGKYKGVFDDNNLVVEEVKMAVENGKTAKIAKVPQSKEDDWDAGWDENGNDDDDGDGWGNDDELDYYLNEDKNEEQKKAKEDVEEEDGWDDNWDDNWDEETTKSTKKSQTVPQKAPTLSYKHTLIPDLVLSAMADYYAHLAKLQKKVRGTGSRDMEDLVDQFRAGLKKVVTVYYMIVGADVQQFYPSVLLFYNDFNRIVQETSQRYVVDLSSFVRLSYNLMAPEIARFSAGPVECVRKYAPAFFDDDDFNDVARKFQDTPVFLEALRFQFHTLNENLVKKAAVNEKVVGSVYLTVVSKVYDELSSLLLKREEFGSDECDPLGDLINQVFKITSNTANPKISVQVPRTQSYNRLDQIKVMILSNLRTIRGDFYDGKFFGLETNEIVSLIKALFVDSPTREDMIDKVVTVRNLKE